MKFCKYIILLFLPLLLTSCFHAVIETGKRPSHQVINKPWASSFVYGLVPPKIVETADKCPNGVARVETKLSFLNQIVSAITLNIYTPMDIKVTCAASPRSASVRVDSQKNIIRESNKEKAKALQKASDKSLLSGDAVYVIMK